jgi:monoamine oxidase
VRAPELTDGHLDVLVVGGGLAGLTPAWMLHSHGINAVVLEAKDRVGGRLLLQTTSNGVTVDGGGSWVSPLHTEVIKPMDTFGLHRDPQYSDGENLLRLRGRTVRYRGDIPRLNPLALLDLGRAMWTLDRMARRLGPPPWNDAVAQRLDAQAASGQPDIVQDIDGVVANYLSMSFADPHLFGDPLDLFESEVRQVLAERSPSELSSDWPGDTEIVIASKPRLPTPAPIPHRRRESFVSRDDCRFLGHAIRTR